MVDRMIVAVFDKPARALQARAALQELHSNGDIVLYASAVVQKHGSGSVIDLDKRYAPPLGTFAATSIGSLIGMIGGPVGVAAGAMSGLAIGAIVDGENARIGEEFVADVTSVLIPGKVALIAQVDEDLTTVVDSRMEAIGGTVFRRSLSDVQDQVNEEVIAEIKADVAALKNR